MAGFKPVVPFSTPMALLQPTYGKAYGVATKTYSSIDESEIFYASFKTYGGTERDINGVYSVEDTAVVETWYNPNIQSDCQVALLVNGAKYEILNEPENVERRNQYMRFKVRRIKGGA